MLGSAIKRPDDTLDYDIDFSAWLPAGDTIQAASASAEGLTTQPVVVDGITIKVWISGGEASRSYTVFVIAETQGGRIKEVCFRLRVKRC